MAVIATLTKGYDLGYIWRQVDPDLTKDAAGYYSRPARAGEKRPAAGEARARRRSATEPHATAERRHELRTEDARCYVSRPASVSCTLPSFHWVVTSLAGLSWSREKRCSRPWWRASTRSVLAPAISADPCVE